MKSASLNLFLLLQQLTSYLTLSLWLPCSLQLSARQKTNGASTCWLYPGLSRIYPGSSPFHLATSDLLHNKKPMELVAFPRDVPYKQLGPRTVHIFNLDLNASLLSWILKQSFTSLSDEATGFAAVPQKCFYWSKFICECVNLNSISIKWIFTIILLNQAYWLNRACHVA